MLIGLAPKESFSEIVKQVQPHIVCRCETKLASLRTLKETLSMYNLIGKCSKQGKGGLMIAAKKNIFSSFLDVTSSPSNDVLVGRVIIGNYPIRIILGYAPQENETREIREEFCTELKVEIENGVKVGESILMIGDFNAKMELSTSQNVKPVTRNGKILYELINQYELNIMNFSEKCTGKWTRVERTTGESSVLDYLIVDNKLETKIAEFIIDESTVMCPFRTVTRNKKKMTIFSDHNAISLKMKINNDRNHDKRGRNKEKPKWKFTTEGMDQI